MLISIVLATIALQQPVLGAPGSRMTRGKSMGRSRSASSASSGSVSGISSTASADTIPEIPSQEWALRRMNDDLQVFAYIPAGFCMPFLLPGVGPANIRTHCTSTTTGSIDVYSPADPTCSGSILTTVPVQNSFSFQQGGYDFTVTCERQQGSGVYYLADYVQGSCTPCYGQGTVTGLCYTSYRDSSGTPIPGAIRYPSGEVHLFTTSTCSGSPYAREWFDEQYFYDTCSNSTAPYTCPDGTPAVTTYQRFRYAGQSPVFAPPYPDAGASGKSGKMGKMGKMGMGM